MSLRIRLVFIVAAFAFFHVSTPAGATDAQTAELYRASYRMEAARNAAGALAKMREIRKKTGSTYFVQLRIAWLSYLAGDYSGSAAGYREAIKAAPKAIEPRLGLTLALLAHKKWRDLERACRDVLRLDARNLLARARLAHALYSIGNYPDCATLYRALLVEYPAELDHQTGLAWALMRMGRRNEARNLFTKVLAVSPDNKSAQAGVAR